LFSRICDWFTRFLVIWVITAVVIAYFFPNYFVGLKLYTDWLFALTMFGIGAVLSPKDFQPIFKKPQKVLLGTLAQFGIMPLLGFLVAKSLNLPKDLALGVILAGAVPGAMASNVITYLAKADVALSIAFTTMSTFLSPVLTPTFTYLFARSFIRIDFWAMFFSIIKMVVLPVISGLVVKHYFGQKLERVVKVFPAMSALFIAFICGLVAALNKDYLASLTLLIFLAVFLHNFFGLFFGYLAGILYRFNRKERRTLAIEVGMQNAGLGAILALKHFSSKSAIPNALFATWCIITASILAEYWSRKE